MKKLRKLLTAVTALLVILGTVNTSVFAAENESTDYVYTDPYVLGSQMETSDYEYAGYWGLGTTPYKSEFIVEKTVDGKLEHEHSVTDNACLFNLISPDKLENTPEDKQVGPWASIIAYCVDVRVDINHEYKYRRINLEDSEYFNVAAAQKLRSIVNNGITVKTAGEVQTAVNAWLKSQGKNEISDVTAEEVLAAAQYSIWYVANEEELTGESTIYKCYYPAGWSSVWNHVYKHDYSVSYGVENGTVTINSGRAKSSISEADSTKAQKNIETMVSYYLSLGSTPAKQVAVSDNTISDMKVNWTKLKNGKYTADVSYNIDSNLDLDTTSDLTISVIKGSDSSADNTVLATCKLTKTGEGTIIVKGLDAPCDLTLEINGEQKIADVFFFDAEDGRYSSQTLIACDDSKLPVHAECTLQSNEETDITETTLTVTKTDINGEKEVEGAELKITEKDNPDKEIDKWISTHEAHVVKADLEVGKTYVITEVTAPKGYAYITTDIEFTVDEDGNIEIVGKNRHAEISPDADENVIGIMVKDDAIQFNVDKTDLKGSEVAGSEITIYEYDKENKTCGDEIIDSWTSDTKEAHNFGTKLTAGKTYLLRETKAPDGYTYIDDVIFEVTKGGQINFIGDNKLPTQESGKGTEADQPAAYMSDGSDASTDNNVVYLVQDDKTKVIVSKIDQNDTPVIDAKLAVKDAETDEIVKDSDGNELTWRTNGKDYDITGVLIAGKTYILTELEVPDGYQKADDIKFTVPRENGSFYKAEMKDIKYGIGGGEGDGNNDNGTVTDVNSSDNNISTGDRTCAGLCLMLMTIAMIAGLGTMTLRRKA